MNKKTVISLITAVIMTICLPLTLAAASETTEPLIGEESLTAEPGTGAEQPSAESSADPETCICGRPYYKEDEPGHMKYECMGCGELISNCTCKCWCGSDIIKKTDDDGTIISVCASCGNRCQNCTCGDMEAVLNFEQLQRDGMISAAGAPKPFEAGTTIVAVLIFFAVCTLMMLYCAIGKDMETKKTEAEARKRMNNHKHILKKIEGQLQRIPEHEASENGIFRRESAEASVKWPIEDIGAAEAAWELVNEIQYAKRDLKTISPHTLFIMHSAIDSGRAKLSALQGEHGLRTKQLFEADRKISEQNRVTLDPAKGLFEDGFFDNAESAFKEENEHITLRTMFELKALACNPSVRIGNAEATAKQWADGVFEERYISTKKDYPHGKRFAGGQNAQPKAGENE